jgi:uncharacterized surface protein with fasciclin (FAS1) repeats
LQNISEYFGVNSVCISSSDDGFQFCYRSACTNETLFFNIEGDWIECESNGQLIERTIGSEAVEVQLICPQVDVTCDGRDGESLSTDDSQQSQEPNTTTTLEPTLCDNIFNCTQETPAPSASPSGNMTDDDMLNTTLPSSDFNNTIPPTNSPVINYTTNNAGIIASRNDLSEFSDLLDQLGISPGTAKTIFAPNSDAFDSFADDEPLIWELYQKPDFLRHREELALWHLVTEGIFTTDDIFNGQRTLMETEKGNITINQQEQTIDGVRRRALVDPNIVSNDGIIHITDQIIVPPYMQMSIIEKCLEDRDAELAFSTMANLALYVGLNVEIDKVYEGGITFLVPPNRRFTRAEIDVPSLLTPEMKDYTRDFILCHMIEGNFYEAMVFTIQQEQGIDEMMVESFLGTTLWITTTGNTLRFQSRDVLLPDQIARNG